MIEADYLGYSIDTEFTTPTPDRKYKYQDKHGRNRRNMIGTKHVQCPACELYFSALKGFEVHRYTKDKKRCCVGEQELLRMGFTVSEKDYLTMPMSEKSKQELKKVWKS